MASSTSGGLYVCGCEACLARWFTLFIAFGAFQTHQVYDVCTPDRFAAVLTWRHSKRNRHAGRLQHEHPDAEQHPSQRTGGPVRDHRRGDLLSSTDYDPGHPGQPPWRSGAEGKAYPLLGSDGSMAAYLKFFTHPTQKRLDRTAWLIGQQMHTWLPNLAAAPVLWTDTRHGLHGAKIDFQFAAYLAKAVPGETWLERKSGIAGGGRRDFPKTSAGVASGTCSWPWPCSNGRNSCMATCRRTTWSSI